MKREAALTIPVFRNDRTTPLHNETQAALIALGLAFGGATMLPLCEGTWVGPDGKLLQEPVNRILIAMEPTVDNNKKLSDIARQIAIDADQVEVYVVYATGEADLVPNPNKQLATA